MKEYKYRMWDKKTEIRGSSAENWLKENPHLRVDPVFIVSVDGIDTYLENIVFTRSILDMPGSTDEEVIQQFIDNLINEVEQEPAYIHKNTELKKELYQAKLTLMKEGLI